MDKPTCSVPGCDRGGQLRRGMCTLHYKRWMKTGCTDKPLPVCPKGHRVKDGRCTVCAEAKAAQPEICTADGCGRLVLARGWCGYHYLRWWRLADPAEFGREPQPRSQCSVDGCDREAVTRGWCAKHYWRWTQTGTTDDPPERPATCSVEGCDRPVRAFGWCRRHWSVLSGRGVAYQLKRNALKAGSQIGPVDLAVVLATYGMVCHICGDRIDARDDLHFDHVIPLSRGGAHIQENIRPAHARCNLSKGTKLLSELAD